MTKIKTYIMTQNEENPKVYPIINQGNVYESGMTLRDHFAGLSMQGKMSTEYIGYSSDEEIAKHCYEIADAMLKQRSL